MTDTLDPQDSPSDTTSQAAAAPQPEPTEPAEPTPAGADAIAPPLAALIASISTAVAKGASAEARAAGATACRSLLTVLEARPGQPLAATAQPATVTSPIAALLKQPGFLGQLAGMSRDQLLDLLKQVTSAAAPRTSHPAMAGPRFHLIELPVRGNR